MAAPSDGSRRLAITGASGLIGRALCRAARDRGWTPVALARTDAGAAPEGTLTRVVGDLGSASAEALAAALADCDALVHLAGHAAPGRTRAGEALWRVNVSASETLAQAAADAGVARIVFVSSAKVFGHASHGPPLTAESAPAPADLYAESKLAAERAVWQAAQATGIEACVVRPPLVCGAGAKGNLARLARAIRAGVPLPFGSLRNRRTLVEVHDLADLLVRCAEVPGAAGRTLLAGDPEALSTAEIARAVAGGLGRRVRLVPVPAAALALAGRPLGLRSTIAQLTGSLELDVGDAQALLGWSPVRGARRGLADLGAAAARATSRSR